MISASGPGIIEPTPLMWVAWALFLALGLRSLQLLPRIWRGEPQLGTRLEAVFDPTGPKTSKAMISMLPSATAMILLGAVVLPAAMLRETASSAVSGVMNVIVNVFMGPFLAACLLMLTVFLFNRPKKLVPPRLRDGGGVLF